MKRTTLLAASVLAACMSLIATGNSEAGGRADLAAVDIRFPDWAAATATHRVVGVIKNVDAARRPFTGLRNVTLVARIPQGAGRPDQTVLIGSGRVTSLNYDMTMEIVGNIPHAYLANRDIRYVLRIAAGDANAANDSFSYKIPD